MSNAEVTWQNAADIEVSIIVVTHGGQEMTLACLGSLATGTDIRSEVIVVDNASPGALAGEIAMRHPEFRLLPQATNLGFAAAANLGADIARGRYLLFLNPDTVVDADAVNSLVELARNNPRAAPLGARTIFADGSANPTCCRRRPTLWRLLCSGLGLETRFAHLRPFSGMRYTLCAGDGILPVDVVCGMCLLMERSLWDRLAGFSPAFFMYGEDDDFSLRARRVGYTPALAPGIAIVHHGSGTEPDQVRKLSQILAARTLVVRGHLAPPARPIARALLLLRPFLGRYFAKPELRPFWHDVWAKRRLWMSGRFA